MAVDAKHPEFVKNEPLWSQLVDCYSGEHVIKSKRTEYLPATEGQIIDGIDREGADGGKDSYDAYLQRAAFPDYVKQGVEAMVGVMHREPARIEVPDVMLPLLDNLGANGETAQMLLRRMNEYQLLVGRAGMMVDVPIGGGINDLPYVALYAGQRVINWDDGQPGQGRQKLEFVVLDESGNERTNDFEWTTKNVYRVLRMSVGEPVEGELTPASGVYETALIDDVKAELEGAEWVSPSFTGRTLDFIPFVFVNTKDLITSPDEPPLMGLSNLCLSIYRTEADYRQALHMQGQDTFVTIGGESPAPGSSAKETRIGAGARVNLPANADAKFVGVAADGLDAMAKCIESDKALAGELTSRLFDTGSKGNSYQSGDALRIRVSAKTATLRSIALTGAEALKTILIYIARWIGADESKIKVEPNLDFADTTAASRTVLELVQAKAMGLPLSRKSLHRFCAQNGLTELSYEEELKELDSEPPLLPPAVTASAGGIGLGKRGVSKE